MFKIFIFSHSHLVFIWYQLIFSNLFTKRGDKKFKTNLFSKKLKTSLFSFLLKTETNSGNNQKAKSSQMDI